jgi:hypothetical protein
MLLAMTMSYDFERGPGGKVPGPDGGEGVELHCLTTYVSFLWVMI